MRILTVCHDLGLAGTQRVAQNFTLAYQRAGHEVAVLAHAGGGPRRKTLEKAGVPVFVGEGSDGNALGAADAFSPEVIHIHRPGMRNDRETELLGLLKKPNRRVVETSVFGRVDRSGAAGLIDIHFQLSKWSMWRWRNWLGRRAATTPGIVVANAVDTGAFTRASDQDIRDFRARNNIPADAYLCGRVGSPNNASWHEAIFDAFDQLLGHDASAWLLVVGLPEDLTRIAAGLRPTLRARITILPLLKTDAELSLAYSALDCFLHAARAGETFGMVLTEAMLCGCPVVTASRPHKGNSQIEVVGHKTYGGVVAGSVQQLGNAAILLHDDVELRQRISQRARQSVIDRYAADSVAATALRAAQLAIEFPDRARLLQKLRDEPGFITHVDSAEMMQSLRDTVGGPAASDLVKMRFVHNPIVQRGIYYYLYWKVYRHAKHA